KEQIIDREPLLRWYAKLFREALTGQNNRKLVIVGYGFRDDWINRTIGEACRIHGLKVFVVDPEDPEKFNQRLQGYGSWQQIRTGWAGYYRWTLRDLFPRQVAAGPARIALRNLTQAVFG
ncbi:MAG: SIR2 family protein, partial [candidate division NC10 bacterium]|nr:SIR2 family protein [candidate division NC10 bacterium]